MSDKLSSRRALGPRRFGRAHHAAWRAGVAAQLRKLRAPVAYRLERNPWASQYSADSTRSDALSHSLSRSRGHMARRRAPMT